MKRQLIDIGPITMRQVCEAVSEALAYYPNAHLGADSRSDDIRHAFRFMRSRTNSGQTLFQAATELYRDAQRYVDM